MASFWRTTATAGGVAGKPGDRDSLEEALSSIAVQRSGYLLKKRFSHASKQGSNWQKRFFVLKDGFLLWYTERPRKKKIQGVFDPHPKGVLPLGGCSVRTVRGHIVKGEEGNSVFEISHPDFNGSLLLAAEDEAEAAQWRMQLNDARRVTLENALMGDAFIEQLEAKGTELQKAADAALQKAQQEADRARRELEEKRALAEKTKQLTDSATVAELKAAELDNIAKEKDRRLQEEQRRSKALESEAEEAASRLDSEREKLIEEQQRRTAIEQQLRTAEATLLKLERALKMTGRSGIEDEITLSVDSLKKFFHEKIEEQTATSQVTGALREGFTENFKYKKETNNRTTSGTSATSGVAGTDTDDTEVAESKV